MTLQASGQIDFSDINVELGIAGATQLSLGGAAARALAGVPSGAIRLGADFYGKSNFTLTGTTPSETLLSETVTGLTTYAYVQPTTAGFMGSSYNSAGSNPAFGSPTGGTGATGKYFKYTVNSGSVAHTNMTAGTWYAVGSGYYVGTKRAVTNGTTTCNISISFANDASGTGATVAGTWVMTCTISPA